MFDTALSLPLLSLPVFLTAAAVSDFRRFIIPNWISLALIGGFLLAFAVSGLGWEQFGEHLALGVGAFAFAFALFAFKIWGGGDGKLFAATALWLDWRVAPEFLIYTMITGGALALTGLFLHRIRFQLWSFKALRAIDFDRFRTHVPYGVAIAVAALMVFQQTDLYRALTASQSAPIPAAMMSISN